MMIELAVREPDFSRKAVFSCSNFPDRRVLRPDICIRTGGGSSQSGWPCDCCSSNLRGEHAQAAGNSSFRLTTRPPE
jgi:hypothetical protein